MVIKGSLTKAGKVKNHTPKVEKKDQKRAKVGRTSMKSKANKRVSLILRNISLNDSNRFPKVNSQMVQIEKKQMRI